MKVETEKKDVVIGCIIVAMFSVFFYLSFSPRRSAEVGSTPQPTTPPTTVDAQVAAVQPALPQIGTLPSALPPGASRVAVGPIFGCLEIEVVARLLRYRAQDKALYERELERLIYADECTLFRKDEVVFVMGAVDPVVRVRRDGRTTEYWMIAQALE